MTAAEVPVLRYLRIRRLAVIDAADVEFAPGFNVLTGETGAGKSVLVGAVGLLLGGRASADLVRTGEESAAVEAAFDGGEGHELIVRREITSQGRSRAFLDGTLVPASALRDRVSAVIELHGQHEHQTLLDPGTHLHVLDQFGGLAPQGSNTAEAFDAWRSATEALAAARAAAGDRNARLELAAFQLAELDRAALKPGEDGELAARRIVLANADRVQSLCSSAYGALYEQDASVLGELGAIWRHVGELARMDPAFQPYLDARDGIKSQLEDLAGFLRQYADQAEASPADLQQVEERLALVERLKRKYGPELADVLARHRTLAREVEILRDIDSHLDTIQARVTETEARYLDAARALRRARLETAAPLAQRLKAHLAELAMEQTRFEVRFQDELPRERWTAEGIDQAEFFLSPNPGEDLRPLARIVSGGELSRVMLALKTMMAEVRSAAPGGRAAGLVFDEVDAGIGGRVADVVGEKLRRLGTGSQVLCITHLPHIAAYADVHFHIAKAVDSGRTRTTVTRLEGAGRVEELSRMLGGAAVTPAIRASAQEMLLARRGGENILAGKGESERAKAKVGSRVTARGKR